MTHIQQDESFVIGLVGKKMIIRTTGIILIGQITAVCILSNGKIVFYTTIPYLGGETIKSIQYGHLPNSEVVGWVIYTQTHRYDDFDIDIL
ncbi:MAG: hypothetical protein A3J55_02155 [Candidatus Ryanbacteria bacterium RIFCSPHIGHO2_02_FULL_45_17b]|uniref:Uncharacterized protein n=1 Tax=Candidatus Ryanbacteria bacterium RIFCSPHIGHO2_01_FULL_45_22 TaxID=1802114 RepID=A0A1G2FYN8_9BACT|nr:MAG: hypothetical protein A2719_00600 [Candidatus Ryanbacteria bacterium RIFCSPHIGHO2_01_FULL_45_22]OGZ46742.1 MAG: hypothetical protein A3J55_02155 [Candidatus Ryanbacteria bacterium RIFCSPHIGHO2_02_FULL_45_17b]